MSLEWSNENGYQERHDLRYTGKAKRKLQWKTWVKPGGYIYYSS